MWELERESNCNHLMVCKVVLLLFQMNFSFCSDTTSLYPLISRNFFAEINYFKIDFYKFNFKVKSSQF